MNEMMQTLTAGLEALGLSLTDAQCRTLCAFAQAVIRQNEVMNLTAITDPAQVASLHLLDSLTVLTAGDFQGRRLIDVGCGAGFPGVPLAIGCPGLEVTLLDSLGKRVRWLEETLPGLGIPARCITARAEEAVHTCREEYDIATSRAVARLNILLELTAPYVRVGGRVIAMKGAAAREELEECRAALHRLGLETVDIRDFQIAGATHTLLIFRKIAKTPPQYPRRYAKIKQSPL